MHTVDYLRLSADAQGESHFTKVTVKLPSVDFAPPAPPLHFAALFPATSCGFVCGPAEWDGGIPHPSPRRQLFCTLRGAYEVTASDGAVRCFPVGSILLLDDTTGTGHTTRIVSDDDVLIVSVTLAEEDRRDDLQAD